MSNDKVELLENNDESLEFTFAFANQYKMKYRWFHSPLVWFYYFDVLFFFFNISFLCLPAGMSLGYKYYIFIFL